jgi:hypothetical protein
MRRCEKIEKSHQVGRGYWADFREAAVRRESSQSLTAVRFLSPAVVIESFNRVDDL